jgi:transcriptional regulator with XRE-family HTH domain
MDTRKRKRIERAGWRTGSAKDFLELSEAETALVEIKITLGLELRRWRLRARISQQSLAKRLQSSQSRVAKMESGDPNVTVDLLIRAALAAGASRQEVASAFVPPTEASLKETVYLLRSPTNRRRLLSALGRARKNRARRAHGHA